jgi:hypothetical protein
LGYERMMARWHKLKTNSSGLEHAQGVLNAMAIDAA